MVVDGIGCIQRQLSAAHARIAELEADHHKTKLLTCKLGNQLLERDARIAELEKELAKAKELFRLKDRQYDDLWIITTLGWMALQEPTP